LATGCLPGHHGIVANGFVDPLLGPVSHSADAVYLEREPLWIAATRSGLKAAVIGWPCGNGPWRGESPWRQVPFGPGYTDAKALDFADHALMDGADLVMAYLSGLDKEGHRHGPGSPEVRARLLAIDAQMAPWIRQQQARHPGLQIWLLADHGMAAMARRVHLPSLLEGLPTRIIAHGGSAYVYLDRPADLPAARARLRRAGLQVWARSELPAAFGLSGSLRTGDLTLLAPSGIWFSQALTPEQDAAERSGRNGAHGYRGQDPGMATWLVVLGTGRRGANIGDIPLTAVAPTVAKELGIRWQSPPDGPVRQDLLSR
jgi:predicted AlkP superfamily pyrophosphatase or phosphodiesterase